MSESKVQSKVMKWLKVNNYWAMKVVVANRAGIPDVIACSPSGLFVAIELKYGPGKPSKLQEYNIEEIKKRGGIAFVAWSIEDVEAVLCKLT